MQRSKRFGLPLKAVVLAGVAALAAGCADSTIHKISDVGDVKTLSLDAKQRLVLVANRSGGDGERITCTEPMPDALVARAAVLSASGNFSQGGLTAGGGASGGSSESAASIGFRNEAIQMLRDGYYRLCEAYMNGALTRFQYQSMIVNADTFMAVISALQSLGNNPTAQAVALPGASLTVTAPGATPGAGSGAGTGSVTTTVQATNSGQLPNAKDRSAEIAGQIVRDYLRYRMWLARELMVAEARQHRPSRSHKSD
jgi:hypothetical protein